MKQNNKLEELINRLMSSEEEKENFYRYNKIKAIMDFSGNGFYQDGFTRVTIFKIPKNDYIALHKENGLDVNHIWTFPKELTIEEVCESIEKNDNPYCFMKLEGKQILTK